ncbi:MAG: UDP-N-acetylmuramoyl-tripeptide--D-alanyl-D-alanine ligase, partial [Proteobacteria bacterium]|nr:UDP-N-acetylmuramoyl-tripeptide--D-alanyl-D-alanine ligase [Burkholderiales bacterium]
ERAFADGRARIAPQLPLVVVDDTLVALGRLATSRRQRLRGPLIAVTASNGKTTIKEMTASILRAEAALHGTTPLALSADPDAFAAAAAASVLATPGNLNNEVGVPLTLLSLTAAHRYAVIEMGMNHAGEIARLTRIAQPDIAVIGNAGVAHLANLGSREAVAAAKGEIFEGIRPGGSAVINADDRFADFWRDLAGAARVLDFGLEDSAAISARWDLDDLGADLRLRTPLGELQVRLGVPGLHNVRNALAAVAASISAGAGLDAVLNGLTAFTPVAGRLRVQAALNGSTLIDDSYNANPESALAAIEVLAERGGLRILVLGAMGELGDGSEQMHAEVGAAARHFGVDRLLTLGAHAARASEAFGTAAQHFDDIEALVAEVRSALAPSVTVLVKGSRFMQMERVAAALRDAAPSSSAAAHAGGVH